MSNQRTIDDRMSDYRAGYSSGYASAKAGEAMEDEVSAARFLNLPVWNVTVYYCDVAAQDDDGFYSHDATVSAPSEESAVELVENALRLSVPTADILIERTEAARETRGTP